MKPQRITTLVCKDTYLNVKRKLLDQMAAGQGSGQISDLIQGLLEKWLKGEI
jgi:hypothetical protein